MFIQGNRAMPPWIGPNLEAGGIPTEHFERTTGHATGGNRHAK